MGMILWYLFLWLIVVGIVLFLARIVLFKTGLIYMVKKWWRTVVDVFHVCQSYKVPEFNDNLQENHLYMKVYSYLNSLSSIEDSDFTNLFTEKKSNEIILHLDRNQIVGDEFLGARVCWYNKDGTRSFVLKIRKADKRRILGPYLQHIHRVTDELEQRNTELKLFFLARCFLRFVKFWCCSNWMRPVFVGNFEYETRHSELERLFSNVKSKFERNQIMVELEAQVMTDTGAGLLFKEQEVEDVVLQ
ncbi:BnaC04g50930D [Brassica napus]|uniref:(rape) hypothetical protein n=1 Tax=Brassica napus TaxID=3708 RepID=A0A078GQ30_BRANA|nr:unnamed protein product [Brassica napus]CDY27312.1 BnaC04g50930D [Brassica napus]